MKAFRYISILFLACALSSGVHAQIKVIPRDKLEATANPRLSPDSALLKFDTRRIMAEPMNEKDAPKTFRYTMTNVGTRPLSVLKLNTTCSCAVATIDRKEIAPGKSAVISVTYDPKGHPGIFERRIFVYTSEGTSPSAILSLAVNVGHAEDFSTLYQHQMGSIRLRRTEVSFSPEGRAVERIPFVNLSGKPLKLEADSAMLPDCLEVSTEPAVLEDRQEGSLIITFDPSRGNVRPRMNVILKGLGVAPSRSLILVKIEN